SRPPTLQAAFAHLALAFRCDVFTLQQRVQVETQARDAAEENIQEELGQCRAALERLGPSCTDAGCKETLEQLRCSLAVLASAIERATSAAEKLGAVHQVSLRLPPIAPGPVGAWRCPFSSVSLACAGEAMGKAGMGSTGGQPARCSPASPPLQGSARRRVSIAVIPKQLLVQGVPGGAVAAVALPSAALLGFLVAASPEHRLPPPRPRPGAAATAACAIAQSLA
ncbi:Lymphoid-restricted membrane protein, partial [Charadrius vociferus]